MERELYQDPWGDPVSLPAEKKQLYVCVSGNSGAGKSTLVRSIAADMYERDRGTIAIDEKSLHHPFISTLFFETASYGFQIQVNFMLQRVMLVQRWLDVGYNVVMERSHLEDVVFIRHLRNMGHVSAQEYDAYMRLWHCLDKRLPHPDLMIYLDVSPKTSLARLQEDEDTGRRPREFPDEELKAKWIYSWYQLYLERLEELKDQPLPSTKVLVISEKDDSRSTYKDALSALGLNW